MCIRDDHPEMTYKEIIIRLGICIFKVKSLKSLERFEKLERLERLERLKKVQRLGNIKETLSKRHKLMLQEA